VDKVVEAQEVALDRDLDVAEEVEQEEQHINMKGSRSPTSITPLKNGNN
jgi:hypothetical protein